MEIFEEIEPLRAFLAEKRKSGNSIGLVPTMGALHEGHLSLIKTSRAENAITVASIYVNPAQFNNSVDLAKYPRTPEADKPLLQSSGCDVLFIPSNDVMYTGSQQIKFDFGSLDKVLEGKFRPGHFSGVALVVSKLFNIVNPDRAYFGQKDYQQYQIIRRLIEELKFPVLLRSVPIARAESGLALSSRNQRLSPSDLIKAVKLYECLVWVKNGLQKGGDFDSLRSEVTRKFQGEEGLELEYFELVDKNTLEAIDGKIILDAAILVVAAYVNGVRLIDNMLLSE